MAERRFRVVVYDTDGSTVFDATGDAYHAIVGYYHHDELRGARGAAGDPHLLEHLAQLIADNPTAETGR